MSWLPRGVILEAEGESRSKGCFLIPRYRLSPKSAILWTAFLDLIEPIEKWALIIAVSRYGKSRLLRKALTLHLERPSSPGRWGTKMRNFRLRGPHENRLFRDPAKRFQRTLSFEI